MTRCIYVDVKHRPDLDSFSPISNDCYDELVFWKKNINARNGYAIKPHHPTSQIIFIDASEHSYGGYILQRLENVKVGSTMTKKEQAQPTGN